MKINSYLRNGFSAVFATYAIYEIFMLPELQIPFIVSLIFSVIFYLFCKYGHVVSSCPFSHKLSYFLFAVFLVVGDSFKEFGSFAGIWGNHFAGTDLAFLLFEDYGSMFGFLNGSIGNLLTLFSSVCKLTGYYFIIKYTAECSKLFASKNILNLSSPVSRFAEKFWNNNALKRVFIFLLTAWIPYLILKFPGSVSNDARNQVAEFINGTFSSYHPLYVTLLYGSFAAIGELLGNQDIGLFIYLLIQCIFIAYIFSYCIVSVHTFHQNKSASFLLVCLYAFSPAFPSKATTLVKDSLYCTVFVWFIIELIWIIHNMDNNTFSPKHAVRAAIAGLLICLTRNNGAIMVFPTLLVLIIKYFSRRKSFVNQTRRILIILSLPFIVYMLLSHIQSRVTASKGFVISETLSIPFQQTARYVQKHSADISEEEANIIDAVLDYENLGQLYNPIVSDPVKDTYKGDDSALPSYFSVWLAQGKRDPVIYLEATVHSNYFLLYPDEPNIRSYGVVEDSLTHFSNPVLKATRILLLMYVMGLSLVPIVSCLINPVYYVWGFIYVLIDTVFKKHPRHVFLLLLPLFLQFINVILGPAVFNQPRYFYPIYYSVPFILLFAYRNKLSASRTENS